MFPTWFGKHCARADWRLHINCLKMMVFFVGLKTIRGAIWQSQVMLDLSSCDLSSMLTFLQELLDKGRIPSMLKVYVTAIAANHALVVGQLVGKTTLSLHFCSSHTVPTWELSIVFRALRGPSFEPLQLADLRPLFA